jgi:hypothetical protein
MSGFRHGSVDTAVGVADHGGGHGSRQQAHGRSEELRGEVEEPQRREPSYERDRPQGGDQGCRAGDDHQIRRLAAESGYSASGG